MNAKRSRGGVRLISSKKRLILIALLLLLSIFVVREIRLLKSKKLEYESKNAFVSDLQAEVESEAENEKQKSDLESQNITDEEYESLAREELGLIKKDEIVIKPR
ncbi:MAG: hypothetical protein IJT67_03720 [Lachnospiraceae bacterium]|nr:hypothetical protein [Lachnospiraceae bacterium]